MIAAAALIGLAPAPVAAQGYPELDANARAALSKLEARVPLAKTLDNRVVAVLVLPGITKAGFLIGGSYGNGVMFRRGRVAGYYNTAGVSLWTAGGRTDVWLRDVLHERKCD
jgi:lipid-binding SYLF domain-containing protein